MQENNNPRVLVEGMNEMATSRGTVATLVSTRRILLLIYKDKKYNIFDSLNVMVLYYSFSVGSN